MRRLRDRCREEPGLAIIAAAIVLWVGFLYLDVWRRHDRFGTFDNDLGFHTQYVWLLARGKVFSTILGLPAFGHNATFGYFLFAPLSWMGLGGPQVLDFVQAVIVALGAVPVYVLARRRLGAGWAATALALAYLLHPVVQGNVWETFHPEAMAMTPLLWAYVSADARRWRPYVIAIALAIIWKSDVALLVAVLGVYVAIRWHRRIGVITAIFGAAWFVFVVAVMIPGFAGGGTVFGPLYGDLGATPLEVAGTAFQHPGKIVRQLGRAKPDRYARDLLAPYGFVPLLGAPALTLGLPQNAISLLSDRDFTRDPFDNPHYQALPLVALTLALVEGVAFISRRRPSLRSPVLAAVTGSALAATVAWGPLPIGVRYHHYWVADHDPLRHAKELAVARPGAHDAVSAQYLLVPHLAQRDVVYSFPNPWRQVFYGIEGTRRPDPTVVKWIVMDETVLSEGDKPLYDCIMQSGAFREVYREGALVAAERVPARNSVAAADLACRDQP